jgi:hypothetical protein
VVSLIPLVLVSALITHHTHQAALNKKERRRTCGLGPPSSKISGPWGLQSRLAPAVAAVAAVVAVVAATRRHPSLPQARPATCCQAFSPCSSQSTISILNLSPSEAECAAPNRSQSYDAVFPFPPCSLAFRPIICLYCPSPPSEAATSASLTKQSRREQHHLPVHQWFSREQHHLPVHQWFSREQHHLPVHQWFSREQHHLPVHQCHSA